MSDVPMSDSRTISRITCEVPHRLSSRVREALQMCGVQGGFVQTSRSVQIRERSLPFLTASATSLEETLSDTYYIHVTPGHEQKVLERLIVHVGLQKADRGTIYSEELRYLGDPQLLGIGPDSVDEGATGNDGLNPQTSRRLPIVNDIAGISCFVPRGKGSLVARVALEMGASVPSVMFGRGTGWRDRLGLVRIAIPAEKEIVTLTSPGRDAEVLAQQIVQGARLNQPGAGFVFLHSLKRGLVNIHLWLGSQRHAASINQIVAAVDALWGDTGWRSRFTVEEESPLVAGDTHGFMRDLRVVTLLTREGQTRDILRAAMEAGAGGATTSGVTQFFVSPSGRHEAPGAVEMTSIIVPEPRLDRITELMLAATSDRSEGSVAFPCIFVGTVPWAYSYRRRTS
ncbi:MAG: hypothetical protein WD492_15695 [Alkalispirochaeta sp.]